MEEILKYMPYTLSKSLNEYSIKSDAVKTNSLAFSEDYSPLIPKSSSGNGSIIDGNPAFSFREFKIINCNGNALWKEHIP